MVSLEAQWEVIVPPAPCQPKKKKRTPRGPNLFKRIVATRLCKSALMAGLQIERLDVDTSGRVSVVVKDGSGEPVPADEVESWLSKQPKKSKA
jgi:hypothetical protein